MSRVPSAAPAGPAPAAPAPVRAAALVLAAGAFLAPTAAVAQPAERVAAPVEVSGVVFLDANGNGRRDANEAGLAGAMVSDEITVVATDAQGRFALGAHGYGYVYLALPDGHAVRGGWWRKVEPGAAIEFAVVRAPNTGSFRFIHASDTHIATATRDRTVRLRALVDSLRPDFVLITGDLIHDALRVPEAEAVGYYDMLMEELAKFSVPVYTAFGNHEIFGIERHRSLVPQSHPLYGKRMYRRYLGPNYFSFSWGGIHFVSLDTADYFDIDYFGHVDAVQMGWLGQTLRGLRAEVPVVLFSHIPLASPSAAMWGLSEGSASTVVRLYGKDQFRHVVSNYVAVLDTVGTRLHLALGGHFHRREQMKLETARGPLRLHQAAAVTTPIRGPGPVGVRSGITLYQVRNRVVDDGLYIPLDPGAVP